MNTMLEYNQRVMDAFSDPQYVLDTNKVKVNCHESEAGERERGVWFKLVFDVDAHLLYYKVYGSPYAIAAVELLARQVATGNMKIGDTLQLESIREQLDMPYPYMHILITLEDAWRGISSV